MTLTRDVYESTSCSLCVMISTAVPCAAKAVTVEKNAAISAGASAAVGSSSSRTAGERSSLAQQFHALLYADRQIFHKGIGINLEPVTVRNLVHARARGRRIDQQPAARFAPKQHVLPHAKPAYQLEMLMYESDGPVRFHGALVGTYRSERDGGQRRFAGAVLADQRVDLAGTHVQIDPSTATTPGYALRMPRRVKALPVSMSPIARACTGWECGRIRWRP